ncbi:MAG: hypothetical protein WBR56_02960 [Sedimenticolaceae bacterium]
MRMETSRPSRFETACYCGVVTALLICSPSSAMAASPELGTAPEIPKLLQQQGWRNQTDADGAVYYHLPQPSVAADEAQDAVVSNVDQLDIRRLLLQRGWRIETDAQGDMLLLPVRPPTPPDIHQMLRERGWRILTDVDGNTLLMPMAAGAIEPTGSAGDVPTRHPEPAPAAFDQPVTGEPTVQFRQALEAKGWTVRTESDGSMIVYPPASAPQAPRFRATHDAIQYGYCEGVMLVAEEIPLPIDSEKKAQLMSTAWIAQFGQAGDAVGKARKVNQVFLVSIVESEAPHALRNQLVVRENGSVIALY